MSQNFEERIKEIAQKKLSNHPIYGQDKIDEVVENVNESFEQCLEAWTEEAILRLGKNRGELKPGMLIGMGHLSKEVYRVLEVGMLGALVIHIAGKNQPFRISSQSDVAIIWTPPEHKTES